MPASSFSARITRCRSTWPTATATRSMRCMALRGFSASCSSANCHCRSRSRSTRASSGVIAMRSIPAYKANREPAPGRAEAPVRAVPRGLHGARARAIRQFAFRGRRHHRHADGCARRPQACRSRSSAATRTSRSCCRHTIRTGTRLRMCVTATPTSRTLRCDAGAHGGFLGADGRRGGQHPRRAGRRAQDRAEAAQALRYVARCVRESRGGHERSNSAAPRSWPTACANIAKKLSCRDV